MYINGDKQYIGKKIKQYRKLAKYSQAELSDLIGMTEKNLSNIERGLQIPSLTSFFKILEVLKISLSEFKISDDNTANPEKEELIKMINLLKPNELKEYIRIFESINTLKKL